MSSGFRSVVTERDTTKVKAYGLAVAIQMILVPLVLLALDVEATIPAFYPLAAVLGGLVFGASMSTAGGCAAGVWYKFGSGRIDAAVAIAGMIVGSAALELGPLVALRDVLQAVGSTAVRSVPASTLAIIAVPLGVVSTALLLRTRITTAGDWTWRRTGLLMGLAATLAWPLSIVASRAFGMAVMPGTLSFLSGLLGVESSFFAWDLLFVLGIPAGAFVAARGRGPVRLTLPSANEALRRFFGGVGLGAGASLAAGCTVGHGLTGLPLLAFGSGTAMLAIFVGSVAAPLFRGLAGPPVTSST